VLVELEHFAGRLWSPVAELLKGFNFKIGDFSSFLPGAGAYWGGGAPPLPAVGGYGAGAGWSNPDAHWSLLLLLGYIVSRNWQFVRVSIKKLSQF
jgi:hypothetical protein